MCKTGIIGAYSKSRAPVGAKQPIKPFVYFSIGQFVNALAKDLKKWLLIVHHHFQIMNVFCGY